MLNELGFSVLNHSVLQDALLRPYTLRTIEALRSLDLTGHQVLDLGCADGILSVVALQQHAVQVLGVDVAPQTRTQFSTTMKLNHLDARASFLEADIRDQTLIDRIPCGDLSCVVANIGPHYDGADVAAIRVLSHLPNARIFIGGGYTQSGPSYNPIRAKKELALLGFTQKYREFVTPLEEDVIPRMAFIVERNL